MSEREETSREPAESVEGTAAAGADADPTEPAGDQDPGAEREQAEQVERLSDDRPPVPAGPDSAENGAASPGDAAEGAGGAATVAGEDGAAAEAQEGGADVGTAETGEADSGLEDADAGDDPLARARSERDEYLTLAQRTQADFDNYRKRAAKEVAAAGARGKASLAREMLPAVDNLERALVSAGDGEASLAEGVRLVHSELIGALERSGVEAIEPAGERFDPNLHEALTTRAEDGTEAGMVLDVVQKGYRLDATVLRPARVVVAA